MNSTYTVNVADVPVGGNSPVSIQTMWKTPLSHDENILDSLSELKLLGCDIIRFAVPDIETAEYAGKLSFSSPLPIVADIHFDYRIALKCMDYNIAKIRINPGNIGAEWKVREVITKAKDKKIPIRVGINSGSLPVRLRKNKDKALALLSAAEDEIDIFEKYSFSDILFSLKSSDVETTIAVNRMFSLKYRYPLHLGVTEAGPLIDGIVKNSAALIPLLKENIGATIRVSLSSTPENEVIAGKAILYQAGKRNNFVNIVSCPKCGRATFDVHKFVSSLYKTFNSIKKPVTIAVMGCEVNGPQEAREADLGITGAGNSVVIFKKGEIIKKTTLACAEKDFIKEIETL